MRKVTLLAILLGIAPLFAVAQSIDQAKVERVKVKLVDSTDRFTGGRMIHPRAPVNLAGTGLLTTLAFSPAIIVTAEQHPTLYAAVYYNGYGWAFLTGKVFFLIDGKRFEVTGADSTGMREVATCSGGVGCIVEEKIRIPISPELANAIVNATSGEMKVIGSKGNLEGRFTEKHVAYFRDVLRQYQALGGFAPDAPSNNPTAPNTRTPEEPQNKCEACEKIGRP